MAWITLTTDDLQPRFAARENDAPRQKALAEGQGDPVPSLIAEAIDLVRGYIAANPKNTLGEGDTIPEKLKNATLNIIRYEALNRLGMTISEARSQAYKDALRLMEQVSNDRFAIDEPETASTEKLAGTLSPAWTTRSRSLGRTAEDGI